MPKPAHQHQQEVPNTDHKTRPDDENVYIRDKQEFQTSEKEKKDNDENQKSSTIPGEDSDEQ